MRATAVILLLVSSVVLAGSAPKVTERNVRELKRPFRMSKVNILWEKAVNSLSERKLVVLHSELMVQDKQELTLKKLKSEGGDKEGKMEASLRRNLMDLMKRFSLGGRDSAHSDPGHAPSLTLFKDKKLNKLWDKAEQSGFSQVELKALKQEFDHHQEKLDQYYQLVEEHSSGNNGLEDDMQKFDHLSSQEDKDAVPEASSVNELREKHRGLKDGYSRLHRSATSLTQGGVGGEFVEPRVAGLWRIATAGDFTPEELESLHTELKHYENRLHKVRYLTAEVLRRSPAGDLPDPTDETERLADKLQEASPAAEQLLTERLNKQRRTVEKLHESLEARILARHSEL